MKRILPILAIALCVAARGEEVPVMPIFVIGNIQAVSSGPTTPTVFTTGRPWRVTGITNYHWNGGSGAAPGMISLSEAGGTTYGPWPASGRSGQGGAPNVYWDAAPDVILPPGTYTVGDSDPATWSHNAGSGGRGFVELTGHAQIDSPPAPPLIASLVYSIDGDPRVTPVVWSPASPAAVVETQITIPAAALGTGTHRLTFGATGAGATDTGPWLTTFVRRLPFAGYSIGSVAIAANADPIFNGGVTQAVTPPAALADATLTLPAGSMPQGLNRLFVRARDPDGTWGPLVAAPLIQAPKSDYRVASVAMAVNADPMSGAGVAVEVNPPAALANVNLNLPPDSVPDGTQRIMVRARDQGGEWGPLVVAPMLGEVIDPLAASGRVTGFEMRVLNAAGQLQAGSVTVSVPPALPFEGTVVWPALRLRSSGSYRMLAAPLTEGAFAGPWAETAFQHQLLPFTEMMNQNFWPPDAFPGLDLTFTGDTNRDGVPNGLAFAFGLSSENAVAPRLPVPSVDGAALIVSFRQRSGGAGTPGLGYQADGIRYMVEYADNPAGPWTEAAGVASLDGLPVSNPDGTDTVSIRIPKPAGTLHLFARLRVHQVPQ